MQTSKFTSLSISRRHLRKILTGSLLALLSVAAAPTLAADADNDGVDNTLDTFPCRADLSSITFVPGENQFSLLAMEDQWPSQGDYDFNDLVLAYNVEIYKNAQGLVKRLRVTYQPRAMGALFDNGVALHLPLASSTGATITRKVGSNAAQTVTPVSGENDLVVVIANNIRSELFANAAGVVNTDEAKATQSGQTVQLDVTFTNAVTLSSSDAPYDVFLFRTNDYGHQIHRPQFSGTTRMRNDLFGTLDDGSNASKKFVDTRGVPFILDLPATTSHPQEGRRFDSVFPRVVDFAASGGTQFQNFFSVNVDSTRTFRPALPSLPNVVVDSGPRDSSCLAPVPLTGLVSSVSHATFDGQGDRDGNTFPASNLFDGNTSTKARFRVGGTTGFRIDAALDAATTLGGLRITIPSGNAGYAGIRILTSNATSGEDFVERFKQCAMFGVTGRFANCAGISIDTTFAANFTGFQGTVDHLFSSSVAGVRRIRIETSVNDEASDACYSMNEIVLLGQ